MFALTDIHECKNNSLDNIFLGAIRQDAHDEYLVIVGHDLSLPEYQGFQHSLAVPF